MCIRERYSAWLYVRAFGWLLVACGLANFFYVLHLTAVNGGTSRIEDGRYILWKKTTGQHIEVSESAYKRIRFHERSLFVTHPLAALGIYLISDDARRRFRTLKSRHKRGE